MTEPHPQRCETCGNHKCEFHKRNRSKTYMGSPISAIIWIFTRERGCASHSSAKSESAVLEELENYIKEFSFDRDLSNGAYETCINVDHLEKWFIEKLRREQRE